MLQSTGSFGHFAKAVVPGTRFKRSKSLAVSGIKCKVEAGSGDLRGSKVQEGAMHKRVATQVPSLGAQVDRQLVAGAVPVESLFVCETLIDHEELAVALQKV